MQFISRERLGALSDGVIAIAATLLVLELEAPDDGLLTSQMIIHWATIFIGWCISFIMITVFWLDNHFTLSHASRWTNSLVALVFLQLALISLIPFGANLIMDAPHNLAVVISFNIVVFLNGMCSALSARLLAKQNSAKTDPQTMSILTSRYKFQIYAYLFTLTLSVAGAYLHQPFLGVILWIIIPIFTWRRYDRKLETKEA